MKATAVIGAGFGDEGKGLMTDYLTWRQCAKRVARFNGGGQAGHTVQLDGVRHVHHTYNSGVRAGADTYLAREFVVNPLLIEKERNELFTKGGAGALLVHQDCRVSTIYDMMLNAISETLRGANRHGSCGLGINETVTRSEHAKHDIEYGNALHLVAGDFLNRSYVQWKMANIKNHWVEERLAAIIGDSKITEEVDELIRIMRGVFPREHADDVWNKMAMGAKILEITDRGDDVDLECLMYEGAQGLMLDEELGHFPHVTRSLTGIPNVIADLKRQGVQELDVVYVTRCYSTRHGAGPFGPELPLKFMQHIVDDTNVHNQWQGSIRFSALNFDELKKFIMADLARAGDFKVNPCLAVTCLDQMNMIPVIIDGEFVEFKLMDFLKKLRDILPVQYLSFGPERKNVNRFFDV